MGAIGCRVGEGMEAQEGAPGELRARKVRHDGDAGDCGYCDERDHQGCSDETPPKSPGGSQRAQELWRKVKKQYELVEYHVLPEYLRDNEYILRHYRSDWPLKETLLSMFTVHNETINIWT